MHRPMRSTYFTAVLVLLMKSMSVEADSEVAAPKPTAERYEVGYKKSVRKILDQDPEQVFGSSLSFRRHGRRSLEFYTLTDKAVDYALSPSVSGPLLGVIVLKKGKATLERIVSVRPKSMSEPAEFLKPVDLEAVDAASGKDQVWMAEEFGPSLLRVNSKDGFIQERINSEAISQQLKRIQSGRGFEGIAVLPNDLVIASVQSELLLSSKEEDPRPEEQKATEAGVIRLYAYDPVSKKSRVYFYLPDLSLFKDSRGIKLGDLQTLDNNSFLVIEQGLGVDGQPLALVTRVSLDGATAIDGKHDRPVKREEFESTKKLKPVRREVVANLADLGWRFEKTEGLALAGDGATLAVTNDPSVEGEKLTLMLIELPNSLFPWRIADILVAAFLFILTAGMAGFIVAVVRNERTPPSVA
jgi:hypothetical protein